jgi:flagellar motor switch protein FliN
MTGASETVGNVPGSESRPPLRAELLAWCEVWKTCLQNVISQVSGAPAAFEISSEQLTVDNSDVWYTVTAGGVVHGEMILHLPSASGVRLARKFLGETEPATEAPISSEQKEALEELLRQIAGLAATALAPAAGGEVKFSLSTSAAPTWKSDAIVCLRTRDEAGASINVELQFSPALATELQARAHPAPDAHSATTPSDPAPVASRYRRLMDVGLDVKLRFGTRRMLLRDVLALSAGVVVELETPLHSPVDLLLDGRLIAQGEVVIIDGKYGLRITDVVDPPAANGPPPV